VELSPEVEVGDEPLEEGLVHGGVERTKQREDGDPALARDSRTRVGRLVLLLFEVDWSIRTARWMVPSKATFSSLPGTGRAAGRTHELGDHTRARA